MDYLHPEGNEITWCIEGDNQLIETFKTSKQTFIATYDKII